MPGDVQKLLLYLDVNYSLHLKFLDGLLSLSLYEHVKLLNFGIIFGMVVTDISLVLLMTLEFILSIIL